MLSAAAIMTVIAGQRVKDGAPVARFEVVRSYPHDPQAFTQGLVFLDGVLYEGTGLNG
ncbi:MAG: glutaminyl-peptide cyclotransferase, partial [Acidobacteria bacterium]|nr:glutaminyl-peptide cyclotransferase [Acidobacteriota bacterium]